MSVKTPLFEVFDEKGLYFFFAVFQTFCRTPENQRRRGGFLLARLGHELCFKSSATVRSPPREVPIRESSRIGRHESLLGVVVGLDLTLNDTHLPMRVWLVVNDVMVLIAGDAGKVNDPKVQRVSILGDDLVIGGALLAVLTPDEKGDGFLGRGHEVIAGGEGEPGDGGDGPIGKDKDPFMVKDGMGNECAEKQSPFPVGKHLGIAHEKGHGRRLGEKTRQSLCFISTSLHHSPYSG